MQGIAVTDIVKLRTLAERLEWYRDRAKARRELTRAAYASVLLYLARQDADELERADGIAPGEVQPRG
jgi:hypothetical protein